MKELTQEQLKEYLHYDPETGIFTRIKCHILKHLGKNPGVINYKGYLDISVICKIYRAHRLAWLYMTGEWPKYQIDHINGIKTDNRICNLRVATNADNQKNSPIYKNNTSGRKGVTWHKREKKWRAQAQLNGKRKSLGSFDTVEEAAAAFHEFAKSNYGEFYRPDQGRHERNLH